MEDRAWE